MYVLMLTLIKLEIHQTIHPGDTNSEKRFFGFQITLILGLAKWQWVFRGLVPAPTLCSVRLQLDPQRECDFILMKTPCLLIYFPLKQCLGYTSSLSYAI
jgi:hypothetical protein